ncbi:cation diffusion facilitator family transporter [Thaumasiovibrio sp. DFM-14]|uniref:cation diffusion facilitator family transporter n=1 Tax=Thaumasiovibrio sp. DFM-14 TaxID=3384792 RepID=UPI0039A04070
MCARTSNNEKQVLTFSAFLASLFAIGGLLLGLWVGSLVILFDGAYSLVSLLLTLLSLLASRYIQKPSDADFPFGRAIIEPVVIAIKASVILTVVAFSLYAAIAALFSGGREIDASIATLFGLINVIGCGFGWWVIQRKSHHFSSDLIDAEAKQWQMDTLLSAAVMAGFIVAGFISRSPFAHWAVYADPLMMCIMSFYFIKVPLDMLRSSTRELLMMSPSKEITELANKNVNAISAATGHPIEITGLTKVGRELRLNLNYHPKHGNTVKIEELEHVKSQLHKRFAPTPLDLQLTLNIQH